MIKLEKNITIQDLEYVLLIEYLKVYMCELIYSIVEMSNQLLEQLVKFSCGTTPKIPSGIATVFFLVKQKKIKQFFAFRKYISLEIFKKAASEIW